MTFVPFISTSRQRRLEISTGWVHTWVGSAWVKKFTHAMMHISEDASDAAVSRLAVAAAGDDEPAQCTHGP